MAYTKPGGIFAGLDDTDPVLRGLDDSRGVYALSGLDDTDPVLRGIGETPPGTSNKDKQKARKSFYYLYSIATMEPVFRKQAGIATGVGVAGVVAAFATGGLSLIASGGAAAAGAIMAAGTENCVTEATLWWQRSKKDRDAYIKNAFVGDDVKAALRKAAKRMDDATKGIKDPLARQRARARAYFQDFIAVGKQSALKTLNADQQAAFGYAYLSALAKGKKEQQALAAGNEAVAKAAAAQAKANKALQMKQVKAKIAEARRKHQEALAAAKAKMAALATQKKAAAIKLAAAQAKVPKLASGVLATPPPAIAAEIKAAQVQIQQVQAEELQAGQQLKIAEQSVTAAARDEEKIAAEVAVADKEAIAAQAPTQSEIVEAAETDSAEDKDTDKVADKLAPAATATSTTPDAAAPSTPAEAAAQAQTEAKGGFPVVPALAVAGIAAFLWMRSKKSK